MTIMAVRLSLPEDIETLMSADRIKETPDSLLSALRGNVLEQQDVC